MRPTFPALALLLAAATLRAQGTPERHTLTGTDVAVYDLVGHLRVVRGTGSDVAVEVARRGADAGQLRVETGPIHGNNTLRVVYPSGRIHWDEDGGSTNMRVRADGTFSGGGGDNDDDDDDDADDHRVTISSRGGLDARADLTVAVPEGKRVKLYLAVGAVTITDVAGDLVVDAAAAGVTASGTRGTLKVDTGSGDVRVTGAEGDLDIDTGSGAVDLTRVKSGVLKVDTGSGSVTGDGVEATRLDVDVGSGDIKVRGIKAYDVRLDGGSGDVDAGFVSDVRSMVIDTGSGEVTMRVPASMNADLEIDTGSGGVDSDLPLTVLRRTEDHLSARLGTGGGRVRVDTGSGGVKIVKAS